MLGVSVTAVATGGRVVDADRVAEGGAGLFAVVGGDRAGHFVAGLIAARQGRAGADLGAADGPRIGAGVAVAVRIGKARVAATQRVGDRRFCGRHADAGDAGSGVLM